MKVFGFRIKVGGCDRKVVSFKVSGGRCRIEVGILKGKVDDYKGGPAYSV